MTETPESDPQAILKMLDAELSAHRQARKRQTPSRSAFRIGSILFIVVTSIAAMAALEYAASRMHPHSETPREAR